MDAVAGIFQHPCFCVDPKDDDVITFLIGHEQKFSGWVETEVAGFDAKRRLESGLSQFSGLRVHGEDRKIIRVTAVTGIKETAVR